MEDYPKKFIVKCDSDDADDVADGNAERGYIIHMPFGTPHMEAYNRFWDWMNTETDRKVEFDDTDFPRVFIRFTPDGKDEMLKLFADYTG